MAFAWESTVGGLDDLVEWEGSVDRADMAFDRTSDIFSR
jgi:hypothetical protein